MPCNLYKNKNSLGMWKQGGTYEGPAVFVFICWVVVEESTWIQLGSGFRGLD